MHLLSSLRLNRVIFACLLVIAFGLPAMAETAPKPSNSEDAANPAKAEAKPQPSAPEPKAGAAEPTTEAQAPEIGAEDSNTDAATESEADTKAATPSPPARKPESAAAAKPPGKQILVNIDKTTQEMTVFVDGIEEHRWPVSTGLYGYTTPSGSYTASSMNEIWYSKQWDNAPMPNAIFFTKKGHAIHGTYEAKKLGKPASHGCVRLSLKNAKTLFHLVKANGLENTQVVLDGETPGGEAVVASQPRYPREADAWPGPGYYYPPPPYGWGRKRRGYAGAPPPGWFRAPPRRRWFQGPGYYPGY